MNWPLPELGDSYWSNDGSLRWSILYISYNVAY